MLGGGLVLAHVITFSILNPNSVRLFATENMKYVVMCARDPDGAVVFQLLTAQTNPPTVERRHTLGRAALVPFALVHAHNLSRLVTDATVGQEIGWVGKYHVETELKLLQQLQTVALQQRESPVTRFVVRCDVCLHCLSTDFACKGKSID